MAKRVKRGTRAIERTRPTGERAGQVAAGVVHLVTSTVVTAIVGAREIGAEVGNAAVTAMRGSIRAAGEIGADVGRLARGAATGAIEAADRIGAAAGRAADHLVDNTMSAVAGIVRGTETPAVRPEPAPRAPGRAMRARGAAEEPGSAGAAAPLRKPLAHRPSRLEPRPSAARRRRSSGR